MWLANRAPGVWGADAARFVPEQWIGEDGRGNNYGGAGSNYDYLTFLQGPRGCIGQEFARAEMRCLLAVLVGGFEWGLEMGRREVVPRGIITMKPGEGVGLRMRGVAGW